MLLGCKSAWVKKDRYVREWTAEILSFVDWRTQEWTRKALKSTIELKGPQVPDGKRDFSMDRQECRRREMGSDLGCNTFVIRHFSSLLIAVHAPGMIAGQRLNPVVVQARQS